MRGGAELHSRISGVTGHLASDEAHVLRIVRDIVATLRLRALRPWEVCPTETAGRPGRALRRGPHQLRIP